MAHIQIPVVYDFIVHIHQGVDLLGGVVWLHVRSDKTKLAKLWNKD